MNVNSTIKEIPKLYTSTWKTQIFLSVNFDPINSNDQTDTGRIYRLSVLKEDSVTFLITKC